jgi:hypothetical protein
MNTPDNIFPFDQTEIGKIVSPCLVNNQRFMEAIFSNAAEGCAPMVVSFEGRPVEVDKRHWLGEPWLGQQLNFPTSHNNYFSLATFQPDESGGYRRTKKQFAGLHALMFDDIGTKIPMEKIGALEPSWKLETSPGNFQVGYLLRQPLTDGRLADQLMKAVIKAELCDPGAGGPQARLARLPEGSNGKNNEYFPCHMERWNPELVYSVEDIVHAFKLDMTESKRLQQPRAPRTRQSTENNSAQVYIACPDGNPVLLALHERGLYKACLEDGKHDITCPWVDEHTGHDDGGTAYFEPNEQYTNGGFHCFHGHCAHRHINELLIF